MRDYFLRALEENDLDWIKDLRNNPETWSYLETFIFLNNFRQQQWFEKINKNDSCEYLVFGKEKKNLGLVRLTQIDRVNRSMCVGGDILPRQRSKGHGEFMYKLIFKLGFEIWGMNRLYLFVLATNKRAINLYEKMSFKKEGVQRDAVFRNGRFIDYLMMSILRREYFKDV